MRPLLFLLLSLTAVAQTSPPQQMTDSRPEILVLGTYHMGNPGRDIANIQADDVRSPQRQEQLAELMAVLKKFNPTKIAIESTVGSKTRPQQYADYRSGKYELGRNEIEQIGFRLAKELGHEQIYPVDEDGDFPWMRVLNYAKANGRASETDALNAEVQASAKQNDDFLKSHTILEMLQRMNSDARVAVDMGFYFKCVRLGEPYEYAGPDLVASWYQRNIRIYSNIVKLADAAADSSGAKTPERILVIYGAGHLGFLRQDVSNDSNVRLRKLDEFTGH